ncbi:MAG: XRE family transcriptional regulator [Thermoguttaceae bacterium]|jgi:transcriptional regulator with XRE-family HTH domain
MSKKEHYTSVAELVQEMSPDEELRAALEERLARRKLVKCLLATRAVKGLSQHDVAQKLHCTQSRVSKLEGFTDDDMRVGDLRRYANAVGCNFVAGLVPRDMKPTDKVKCHVFTIKKHMDDLARLARSDSAIAEGVGRFFYELFINFSRLIGDSARLLPNRPDESPYFSMQLDVDCKQQPNRPKPCCLEADCLSQATP